MLRPAACRCCLPEKWSASSSSGSSREGVTANDLRANVTKMLRQSKAWSGKFVGIFGPLGWIISPARTGDHRQYGPPNPAPPAASPGGRMPRPIRFISKTLGRKVWTASAGRCLGKAAGACSAPPIAPDPVFTKNGLDGLDLGDVVALDGRPEAPRRAAFALPSGSPKGLPRRWTKANTKRPPMHRSAIRFEKRKFRSSAMAMW